MCGVPEVTRLALRSSARRCISAVTAQWEPRAPVSAVLCHFFPFLSHGWMMRRSDAGRADSSAFSLSPPRSLGAGRAHLLVPCDAPLPGTTLPSPGASAGAPWTGGATGLKEAFVPPLPGAGTCAQRRQVFSRPSAFGPCLGHSPVKDAFLC